MTVRRPYDFRSDNAAGVHPRILAAMADSSSGVATAYGVDPESAGISALYSELFEHEVFVFATPSGTAANGLALGAVTPAYGAIFCHAQAHIVTTECGAPEFFSGGARLIPLEGPHGKLTPDRLATALQPYRTGSLHQLRASTLSITQSTEAGAVYTLDEIAALSDVARAADLKVHMDGARFANALVRLGCTPAQMSWKAGIDILSFGTTKNGTMNAEAVIVFEPGPAETVRFMHKRAGFLQSKMRFMAAQLRAYVQGGLWLDNACQANASAQRLSKAFAACPDARLDATPEANEMFIHLSVALTERLARADIVLRPWPHPDGDLVRVVTSFADSENLIARLEASLSSPPNSTRP